MIRGNAAVVIGKIIIPKLRGPNQLTVYIYIFMITGILHSLNRNQSLPTESISNKVKTLLRDEQVAVRVKAANALGYMFSEIV